MLITAKGYLDKKHIEVAYDSQKDEFYFDKIPDAVYSEKIRFEMSRFHPIGGTFVVENEKNVRNVINVLSNHFFDKPTLDITCSEEIEPIPQDGGDDVVY